MILMRVLLCVGGVISAILFQAWSLPFFLSFTLLSSWIINQKNQHGNRVPDGGAYFEGLIPLFLMLYLIVFLAGFNRQMTLNFLELWDGFSKIQVSILADPRTEINFLNRNSLKLVMNFTSLAVPIYVAVNFHKLIGPFPVKNLVSHPFAYFFLTALFLFCAVAPLWVLTNNPLGSFGAVTIILFAHFMQTVIILFYYD